MPLTHLYLNSQNIWCSENKLSTTYPKGMPLDKFCPLFIFLTCRPRTCNVKNPWKVWTCEVGRTNYNLLHWSDHDCQTIGATDTPPTTINIIGILITISKHITKAKQIKITDVQSSSILNQQIVKINRLLSSIDHKILTSWWHSWKKAQTAQNVCAIFLAFCAIFLPVDSTYKYCFFGIFPVKIYIQYEGIYSLLIGTL